MLPSQTWLFCLGTRGFQAHFTLLEEAAFMPDVIWQKVVLPVYGNENNSVLMITTLDG
jgi:hypothetical protein